MMSAVPVVLAISTGVVVIAVAAAVVLVVLIVAVFDARPTKACRTATR
jgi:hypothetical protein